MDDSSLLKITPGLEKFNNSNFGEKIQILAKALVHTVRLSKHQWRFHLEQ